MPLDPIFSLTLTLEILPSGLFLLVLTPLCGSVVAAITTSFCRLFTFLATICFPKNTFDLAV
ncbi:hypothetical protein FRACYDRAFT_270435 [Fragilariopsis cylindrus CCMP1102]|uniref:Uncharacterized protein n=1 Tax=Fragilariopsis cylindrus CCMP1102 TaxID=635003 RepID=A0A1E7F3E1_9STRA|nr:hypothetical protein FRACYDRAFT_270435 [Fragilariopsis cylindrus CCMP1102]|eukprot:OEU12692.1 hypothetical protein FRACYDRAFT_270435 [Fragilariopsis cylindrus CCMP1102]